MSLHLRLVAIGVLFLLKFLSGIWVGRSGKPIHTGILTIHKVISLLTVVFIAITIRHLRGDVGMSGVEIGVIVVTGVLFFFAILSGGLLSTGKPMHPAILIVHQVTPFLTALSTVVMVYLLAWAKL
jgi:hypothetical protein